MKLLHGIGASSGIAIGNLRVLSETCSVKKESITNIESELSRMETAKNEAVHTINTVYQQSIKRIGEKNAEIFQIHLMMIQDEDFLGAIKDRIEKEQVNAEYAVWTVAQEFADRFSKMDSEYMRGRKADVMDIAQQLIKCLDKSAVSAPIYMDQPVVLAATELTPSETMQLDQSKILAIVTQKGSRTSHASILARTMGIPAVIGLNHSFEELENGLPAVVNGSSGELILSPDENTLQKAGECRKEFFASRRKLQEELNNRDKSEDESRIAVFANIGRPSDVREALENGAEGIGLFRSEFLYLERDSLPGEEEQFQAYRQVLDAMKGKPVIIRTLDIGADKQVPYLNLPKEANPALGYRAIRICLDQVELFRTQIRALLRASIYGNLKIMFPMIISVEELRKAKIIVEQTKQDLKKAGISYNPNIPIGIMVETPAAVMLSDDLGKECDFFSIGTNDLTQYTLAVDRMNGKLSALYNPKHPAVLKMLEMTASNAKRNDISVGICGELAADPDLIKFYQKIGINELSMASASILQIKQKIYGL